MTKIVALQIEFKDPRFYVGVAGEFIATFILLVVQCMIVARWDSPTDGTIGNYKGESGTPVQIGLGMGFIVTLLVEAMGPVSGAHINPAVTLAMLITQRCSIIRSFVYVIIQIAGALAGAGFAYGVLPADRRGNLAVTSPGPGVTEAQALCVEVVLTAMLILIILGATDDRLKQRFIPSVPIGMGFCCCVLTGIKHSGASLNPARSLAPAVIMGLWRAHWVYWVGPLLGASLSALLYRYGFAHILYAEDDRDNKMTAQETKTNYGQGVSANNVYDNLAFDTGKSYYSNIQKDTPN